MGEDKDFFKHTLETLNEYAEQAKALYKQKLILDGRKATGNLIDTVETKITSNDYVYTVSLELADYYKFVDDGRKVGKQPPREAILQWIKVKHITPTPDKNGKLPTEKQLSFLIARSIGQKGTLKEYGYGGRGGNYIAKTQSELNAVYLPKLRQALERDWIEAQAKILEEIEKIRV